MLFKSGYSRFILAILVSFLLSGSFARADNAAFDLSGPRLELKVTRAEKTLPISQVPTFSPATGCGFTRCCLPASPCVTCWWLRF